MNSLLSLHHHRVGGGAAAAAPGMQQELILHPPEALPPPPVIRTIKPRNRTFEENYAELLTYKARHGDIMVPNRYKEDRVLGKWVSHLREYYAANGMSQERIKALDAIGFVWNPHEKRWNDSFERLKVYKEKFGDCRVPTFFKDDKPLGKWVARQREDSNDGVIQPDRKKKLDELDFIWQLKKKCNPDKRNTAHIDEKWDKHFQKLLNYVTVHGHPNVPDEWSEDRALSKWVKGQRVIYNRNLMPKDRLKKLQDIGFVFGFQAQKKQKNWNRMYDLLKVCQKEDGSFQVSLVGDDAPSVARWIQRQREAYRMNKMEPGREILLRKLNFQLPDKQEPEMDTANAVSDQATGGVADVRRLIDNGVTNVQQPAKAFGVPIPIVDGDVTAFEPGTDVGKKVAESVGVLAKFMSISPEEVASRLSLAPSIVDQVGNQDSTIETGKRSAEAVADMVDPQGLKRTKI